MTELLCHLVGDYIFQTDAMATKKTKSWVWATFHAATYTLPFLALTRDPVRLGVILSTHAVIDRLRLARYVVAAKNFVTADDAAQERAFLESPTGYLPDTPPWMAVWLLIIADNTLHLLINHAALLNRESQNYSGGGAE